MKGGLLCQAARESHLCRHQALLCLLLCLLLRLLLQWVVAAICSHSQNLPNPKLPDPKPKALNPKPWRVALSGRFSCKWSRKLLQLRRCCGGGALDAFFFVVLCACTSQVTENLSAPLSLIFGVRLLAGVRPVSASRIWLAGCAFQKR